MGRALISFVVFTLAATGSPEAASADERRIVLLEVEGARDSRLRKQLAILIRSQHKIVSADRYQRAARKSRARKLTPSNVRRVCRDLPCDGLLGGTLVADDGSYEFEVRLREGATGRLAKKVTIRLKEPRLTVKIGKQLRKRLLVAIDRLRPVEIRDRGGDEFEEGIVDEESADREDEREALRRRRERELARKRERERERRRKERRREAQEERFEDEFGEEDPAREEESLDDFDDSELDEEDPDRDRVAMADDRDEPEEDAGVDKGLEDDQAAIRWNAPVTLAGGVSVVSRSLDFSFQQGLMDAPPGYAGSYVPAAYVTGELYPFDLGEEEEKGPLKDFGVGFYVERVLQLESAVTDEMGAQVANLATTQQRFGLNVRYRYQFNDEPDAPSIAFIAGVSRLTFHIEKGDAPMGAIVDVPNTRYTYIDPGVFGRFPVTGNIAILAEAKGMLVLDAGEIQEPEEYGTATVTGVDADAAIEYAFDKSFSLRVGGHLTLLGFAFKGNGLQTTDRDDDPGQDIGGARDAYLGGYAAIGYRY